ncbi:large ribosomal subunit protein uL10m isoform X2 [Denticeps clupeoides]|uniref:large ribosomal subunit protein uL10m isoform X2 n=1 Tax=Denticeps clupeoides TaxID=299321 RepID=UPI0010A430D5|nr:39S ribosomal protein L10, mitochondrial isoform X2 [Denticeps clupeoides]
MLFPVFGPTWRRPCAADWFPDLESGLVVFLKRDLEALFRDHKMIAVAQNNASNAEDTLILKQRLLRHDIRVKFFPVKVVRSFLENTPYRNMKPLFIGHTVLFVSKEPKAKEMLATLKGSPQMVLLGGCIENTLLSVQGIVDYSRLPSHATIQGQLVSGLTAMTSRTASMLQHHPSHLSALLQQYVKQQSAGAAAGVVAPQSTSVPEGAA